MPEEIRKYIPSYEYELQDFSPKSKASIVGGKRTQDW